MNINQAIQEATNLLNKNNIKSSKLDSEILMAKVIKKKREYIILNSNKPLQNDIYNYFKKLIKDRSYGKPIAYLVGNKEFWKYKFKVSDGV